MLYNYNESYQLFKKEFPDINIGRSKFIDMRPKNVVPCSDKDHNQCCCIYHENYGLLFEVLKDFDILSYREFLGLCVCSKESLECHIRECENCPKLENVVKTEILEKLGTMDQFKITQWNKTSKQPGLYSKKELGDMILKQSEVMLKHQFIAKHQINAIKSLKSSLSHDEILVQEDFSENYNIKHLDEIMSAHWQTSKSGEESPLPTQVALFTAIVYKKEQDFLPIVLVTDCLTKDKLTVAACNKKVFQIAQENNYPIEKVHIFSDGCGGQFKNCYTLSLLKRPDILNNGIK